jgi:hypothetical protein
MPNERYVKISMRDRWDKIPYDNNGDPAFENLFPRSDVKDDVAVASVFTYEEIVHLVNKALYTMKYQRETHANRRRNKESK